MKACTLCGETKALDEFHRNKSAKDGRQSRCKTCASTAAIQWRKDHPDRAASIDRKYTTSDAYKAKRKARREGPMREVILDQKRQSHARHAEENAARNKAWRDANPDKTQATRRRYYVNNREVVLARNMQWQRQNLDHLRRYRRMRSYGLTPERFDEMLVKQAGRCAACGEEMVDGKLLDGIRQGVHVDHNHETGAVRGLLCSPCNLMLGHAKDQPSRLRAAADYLERYQN